MFEPFTCAAQGRGGVWRELDRNILETGAHRWCASLSWSSGCCVIVLAQAMFGGGHGIQWTWRGGLSESRLRFANFINRI